MTTIFRLLDRRAFIYALLHDTVSNRHSYTCTQYDGIWWSGGTPTL